MSAEILSSDACWFSFLSKQKSTCLSFFRSFFRMNKIAAVISDAQLVILHPVSWFHPFEDQYDAKIVQQCSLTATLLMEL
jgi:hypothetical protein